MFGSALCPHEHARAHTSWCALFFFLRNSTLLCVFFCFFRFVVVLCLQSVPSVILFSLGTQVTTSAESTTGDAPMTSLSPVLACVTTSAGSTTGDAPMTFLSLGLSCKCFRAYPVSLATRSLGLQKVVSLCSVCVCSCLVVGSSDRRVWCVWYHFQKGPIMLCALFITFSLSPLPSPIPLSIGTTPC